MKPPFCLMALQWSGGRGLCVLLMGLVAVKGAAQVLVRDTATDPVEFAAYCEAEGLKTFARWQKDKVYTAKRPVQLKALLARAQAEFLSPDPLSSKATYQKIVSLSHAQEWNEEERKIIFYSFFRLAQLEKTPASSRLFLKEAMVFGRDLKPQVRLFPPPLIQTYRQIKKQAFLSPLHLKSVFAQHEWVLINGKAYKNDQKLMLPYGVYRVKALSSSHEPYTEVIPLSRLVLMKVKTPRLVTGTCEGEVKLSAFVKSRFKSPGGVKVLFPGFCVWDRDKPGAGAKALLARRFKEVPLGEGDASSFSSSEVTDQRWFWWGLAGLVAGGAVISFWILSRKESRGVSSPRRPSVSHPDRKPAPAPQAQKPVIRIGF